MKNNKLLIILTILIALPILFVLIVSLKFNFMNFTLHTSKPYFIKATVTEQSPDEITFSKIKPFVFWDKTDVIAVIRNFEPKFSNFNTMPSSSDIFRVETGKLKNIEVGQETRLKFYPLTGEIEKAW